MGDLNEKQECKWRSSSRSYEKYVVNDNEKRLIHVFELRRQTIETQHNLRRGSNPKRFALQ